uniref:Si:ch211-117l17.7 n=1 Tax=Acanthochromis polyacanthus TaxID=80966 RepID=A0A3Q1GE37_9TELE
MPEIAEFYLYGTNLTTVPENVFANMSGLQILNFHLNDHLKELPQDLFCCLHNLTKLSLKSNNLSHLHPELFSKLPTLNTLVLNDNKLENLPENIFQNLTGVLSIDLKNNQLQTLSGGTFSTNTALNNLYLSGNPWNCDCDIRDISQLQGLLLRSSFLTSLRVLSHFSFSNTSESSDFISLFWRFSSVSFSGPSKNPAETVENWFLDRSSFLTFFRGLNIPVGRELRLFCWRLNSKLPPTIFHSLTKLRRLIIHYNELEELEVGIFDQLVNLTKLRIEHNQISSLPPQVFWSLRNLKMLTLSNNRLLVVPDRSFYFMPKLSTLTLFNNPLLSLPDELMGYMPEIAEFYLYGTNLTTVPENVFANMSGLQILNFHLNDHLKELPQDLFCCLHNLTKLSLKSNNLSHLHPELFSKLPTLNTLVLNDNKLENLPENIFQNLTGVLSIDLKNNQLQTLSGGTFSTNTALNNLYLSGNPWNCDCDIRDIARWIKHNKQVVLDSEDVMCHSPVYQLLSKPKCCPNFNFWALKLFIFPSKNISPTCKALTSAEFNVW